MRKVSVQMVTLAYPADECEQLVKFAGKGLSCGKVHVVVLARPHGISGRAPGQCSRRPGSTARVELRLGPKSTVRPLVLSTSMLRSKLPVIPCRDWKDAFVWLAGHELRHVWQLNSSPCCLRCAEEDAEQWAMRTLNRWRRSTGRLSVQV